jgi:hypothetical protein
VDLAPTLLSALDRNVPRGMDGTDRWDGSAPTDDRLRAEVWNRTSVPGIEYAAAGVWDGTGGWVQRRGSRLRHLAFVVGGHLVRYPHASMARSLSPTRNGALFGSHLRRWRRHGDPGFTRRAARDTLPGPFQTGPSVGDTSVDAEQLRQLGYLE